MNFARSIFVLFTSFAFVAIASDGSKSAIEEDILTLEMFHLPDDLDRADRRDGFDLATLTDFQKLLAACQISDDFHVQGGVPSPIDDLFGYFQRDGDKLRFFNPKHTTVQVLYASETFVKVFVRTENPSRLNETKMVLACAVDISLGGNGLEVLAVMVPSANAMLIRHEDGVRILHRRSEAEKWESSEDPGTFEDGLKKWR